MENLTLWANESLTRTESDILRRAEEIMLKRINFGDVLKSSEDAGKMFQFRLGTLEHEAFAAAFLDTRHRIIQVANLFRGTIDGVEVHPRIVVQAALRCNAAAVIVAHNHPSHENEPSAADRNVTVQLKQALALVDVRLLDHFVVSASGFVSLARRGWV